jgi:predicted transcriptional regulator
MGKVVLQCCVTETLTIRLPKALAREFRAKTRAANTNPTVVLRQAAMDYVAHEQMPGDAIVMHIQKRAGT